MTLTQAIKFFQSKGACKPALDWLKKQKKARKGLRYAIENCNNFNWLDWGAEEVNAGDYDEAITPLWEAYEKARVPLWEAYEKARVPLWEAYWKAIKPHRKAYYEATAPHLKAYEKARAPFWKAYDEAIAPHLKDFKEGCKIEARKILLSLLDK